MVDSEKVYFISAFLETMLPGKGRTFAAEKSPIWSGVTKIH
jgi:hypothetical protein